MIREAEVIAIIGDSLLNDFRKSILEIVEISVDKDKQNMIKKLINNNIFDYYKKIKGDIRDSLSNGEVAEFDKNIKFLEEININKRKRN